MGGPVHQRALGLIEDYLRRLNAAMETQDISYPAVAEAAGLNPSTAWRVLGGQVAETKATTLLALGLALGVPPCFEPSHRGNAEFVAEAQGTYLDRQMARLFRATAVLGGVETVAPFLERLASLPPAQASALIELLTGQRGEKQEGER